MNTRLLFCLLCTAASASAQNYLTMPLTANPAQELPNYGLLPFRAQHARVQMFFDATEVGASTFTATELSLRYDGPIPPVGPPGPFTIQDLQIRIGTTTVAIPESRFANNLTSPLTTVSSGQHTYYADQGSIGPQAWGEANGSLTFPFQTPVAITIPAGGWLVIEFAMTNNNFGGVAHTFLDGANTTGGPIDGQAVAFGQGCSIGNGAPAITIGTAGRRAPGAAQFVTGQNLGANAPVFVLFGLDNTQSAFGPLPFRFPGTGCDLLTRIDANALTFATPGGALESGTPGNAFAVPADPAYAGLVLHEQLAALAPAANPLGLATSNAQTVTLGTITPPGRGTYAVGNNVDANATIATEVKAFGYAVRLRTL